MAAPMPSEKEQQHDGELADVGVQLLDDPELTSPEHMSPAEFAEQLCVAATLNRDQRRPVAIIALEMGEHEKKNNNDGLTCNKLSGTKSRGNSGRSRFQAACAAC